MPGDSGEEAAALAGRRAIQSRMNADLNRIFNKSFNKLLGR
jgi:hypothetical protein